MSDFANSKLVVKALLGFKYNCLMQKGARLLIDKQKRKCLIMSMDALKYNTLVSRITRRFSDFRE